MKKDIDRLMKETRVDTIYAMGSPSQDPTIYYLFNGVNVSGYYIKKSGMPAYLIHVAMEREEAIKTHLKLININKYDIKKIFEKYRDKLKANAYLIKIIFDDLKVKGRVAFYGNIAMGTSYNLLGQLKKLAKNIEIHYEPDKGIIARARETKDEEEVRRIKKAGSGVTQAFDTVLNIVQKMKVKNNTIIKGKGEKLLIGDLKNMLKKELLARNLVCTAGLIVSQGSDGGVPHNSGKDREAIKLGKPIVFDIYPQELGGGYFFDFTRTVCFGCAPQNIKKFYNLVRDAQDLIIDNIKVGKRTIIVEQGLCKFFEKNGHETFISTPKTQIGYCHSLGHGLGLNIHESPSFGLSKTNFDRLEPGMVFTIEPGLYYPDKGFGIRLEDVVYIDKKSKLVNLTNYPRNLVVEM